MPLKDISYICCSISSSVWKELLLNKNFPNKLKLANVAPIFALKKCLIFATLWMKQLLMFMIQI